MTEQESQAHHDHPEVNYMGIFGALTLLTIVEVAVVFLPLAKFFIGVMLILMAFSKAILVAGYFMHLRFENKTLAIVAATPVILCVFLMFMLLPDSNPDAPGRPAPTPPSAAATGH